MSHPLKEELFKLIKIESEIFAFIQSGILDGLWYWDLENPDDTWMDERFWTTLGYDPAEKKHLASEWQQVMFEQDVDAVTDNLQKHLIDPMHPYDQIVRFRHKNGSTVLVRCRGVAIRNEEGKPIRVLGAHTDITEAISLSEQERLMAAAMSASPVGNLIGDIYGNILQVNDAMASWLGYSVEDLRFMHILDITPDCDKKYIEHLLNDDREAIPQEVLSVRKQYKHRDGRLLWGLESAKVVRDNNGKVIFVAASVLDIQTEMELKHTVEQKNLELTRANRELDQFAFIASHDLKSPLVGIRRLAGWIHEDCKEILPEASRRHLRLLDDRIRRMEGLLGDLLDYSRVGTEHYDTAEINLAASGNQIIQLLDDAGQFELIASEQVICIQRIPFEMVLRNLIDNAVKHNPLKQGKIFLDVVFESDNYIITVEDDGPGIDPGYQDKVMDMFQRLSSKDEIDGSGMGLALVKKIVESYNGSVKLVSDGVNGTKVMIRWPKPVKSRT